MKYNAIKHVVPPISKDRETALHRRALLLLALFLSCVFLWTIGGSASIVAPAYGAKSTAAAQSHRDKAQKARKEATLADKKVDALKKEIRDLDEDAERFAKQAAALKPEIKAATEKNAVLTQERNEIQAQVNELSARVNATQTELDHQQALLNARANQTYRNGSEVYLNLLFGAQSLEDLVARTDYVMQILTYNSQISQNLTRMTRELEAEKAQLDEVLAIAAQNQHAAAVSEQQLRDLQTQNKQAEANATALQQQKSDLMKDTKANAARLRAMAEEEEAMARQLNSELARSGSSGSGIYEGKMTWPVPGYTRISSPFGPRICPFHGRENHSGVDIARTNGRSIDGAAIVAAGPGTVISAGYRGGYGYTVIIDHGNGVTTLYAHQQAGGIKVSNGQSVGGGERIGTVGTTGSSTGPHLHWEVRVNGVPKNPMTY